MSTPCSTLHGANPHLLPPRAGGGMLAPVPTPSPGPGLNQSTQFPSRAAPGAAATTWVLLGTLHLQKLLLLLLRCSTLGSCSSDCGWKVGSFHWRGRVGGKWVRARPGALCTRLGVAQLWSLPPPSGWVCGVWHVTMAAVISLCYLLPRAVQEEEELLEVGEAELYHWEQLC